MLILITLFLLEHAANTRVQTGGSTVVSEQVIQSEIARFHAMVRADTTALAGMLADDLFYVHSSGRAETKPEFLKAVGSRAIQYLAFEPVNRRVTILDPAGAVIMGRANARVISKGQHLEFDVRYIAVYSRVDRRWQLRCWQTTRVSS